MSLSNRRVLVAGTIAVLGITAAYVFMSLAAKTQPPPVATAEDRPRTGPPELSQAQAPYLLAAPTVTSTPSALGRGKVFVSRSSSAWRFEEPTGGVSAAQLFAQLASRPISIADSSAVAALADALVICRKRVMLEATLQSSKSDSISASDVESIRSEIRQSEAVCSGLPKEAFDKSDSFIEQLAAQGDLRAMALYSSGDKMGFGGRIQDIIRDPEKYRQYKENTIKYLDQLIDAGYYPALGRMSDILVSQWFEPDPARSWAYQYAASLASGDTNLQQLALARLPKWVPPEKQQEAQALAQQIFLRCCRGK